MSDFQTYAFIGNEGHPKGTRALGRVVLGSFAIMTSTDVGWVEWDPADWVLVKTDPCEEHRIRYEKLTKAMTVGVHGLHDLQLHLLEPGPTTEHARQQSMMLRVGVNSTLVETASLVQILIDLGFLSREHWYKTLAGNMEAEVKRYEEEIGKLVGKKVVLERKHVA